MFQSMAVGGHQQQPMRSNSGGGGGPFVSMAFGGGYDQNQHPHLQFQQRPGTKFDDMA